MFGHVTRSLDTVWSCLICFWLYFCFVFLSLTCMCPSPNSTSFLSPAMSSFSHTDLLQMPSNNSIRKQIETLQVSCLASVACAALPLPFPCPDRRLARFTSARLGNWTVAASPWWQWDCTGVFDERRGVCGVALRLAVEFYLVFQIVALVSVIVLHSHICECCLAVLKRLSILMKGWLNIWALVFIFFRLFLLDWALLPFSFCCR